MNQILSVLDKARRSSDVILAVCMAAILGAMIIPLPAWLLDAALALNLAAAVSLLVAALFARDALKVASFPTLLLLTTLFRLALNVSSTRLALAEGNAGNVIQAFGEFVVRGDYVVGAVVFAILALVQFLVVAKGAERVAEVSARFTLDAMPGKQMSIDADLRAGAIDQAEARRRRRELERESQMFGAMDGAMKFVKGDVIAGLVIVLVNLVAGTAVGVLQNGMDAADALSTYALIAIGDGLVSQIPSLCIAVAAGLVVTRVSAESESGSLGSEIGSQFFGQSKALWVVSGLCLALGLMPGMPRLPFILIAAAAFGGGHAINKLKKKDAEAKTEAQQAAESAPAPEQHEPMAAGVAPLTIDLAPDLTAMVHEAGSRFAKQELNVVRDQIFFELGVRVPGIRVRTGASYLAPGQYVIMLDEVPLARGQVKADALYAMGTPADVAFLQVKAEAGSHPATGKPMCKVTAESRAQLEAAQILVRTPAQLICEHLTFVLRRKASALLGVQEVQALIEQFEPQAPALVKEALNKVPLALLTDVLKKLVTEEVSVRNLRAIFDALVSPSTEGDANALAEKCRAALHRYLSHKYAPNGPLFAYLVDPAVEDTLRQRPADMDPDHVTAILDGVKRIAASGKAVLLAAPDVRRSLRRLCEGAFPEVAVLTYGELDSSLQIRPLGKLAAAR